MNTLNSVIGGFRDNILFIILSKAPAYKNRLQTILVNYPSRSLSIVKLLGSGQVERGLNAQERPQQPISRGSFGNGQPM